MPKQLNPKLWDGWELKPEVLNGIKKICDFFINNHMDKSIKINPVDIHIVGSNAGFNYTDKSDVDVHIIDGNTNVDELTQYAQWKAVRDFNKQYDITLKGVPVELYIENINSPAVSRGVFSVNKNKWITMPRIEYPSRNATEPTLNDKDSWVQLITQTIKNGSIEAIDMLLTKLYAMRKGSIASSGETGEGNLLFKALRDGGYVDKLKDAKDKAVSKELSVESLNEGLLMERTRGELIRQSQDSSKGMQRYKRRTKSRVANTVAQYNRIDMNKLFKEDILTVDISVTGETDNYTVKISFGGFLKYLRNEIKNGDKFDLRAVIRALITGFDKDDTFVWCSCEDFKFRFQYQATQHDYNSGEPQPIPARITNPNNSLGSACKHILLVLSNHSWILKVASVIRNYVQYMEKNYPKMYADIIYPAIYGKKYEAPVQMQIDDTDELQSDTTTLDKSNSQTKKSTHFQRGNKLGWKFAPKQKDDKQTELDIENQ